MKNFNSDLIDLDKINQLHDMHIEDGYESYTESFEEDINHSRGWSYVCLNETISYYIKQNIDNE